MMTRKFLRKIRKTLSVFGILFSLFFLISCSPKEAKDTRSKKPNIAFIFADDLTLTAINALGNQEIETPILNRLVDNGVTFTNAYNMGAWYGAVCAASRVPRKSKESVC